MATTLKDMFVRCLHYQSDHFYKCSNESLDTLHRQLLNQSFDYDKYKDVVEVEPIQLKDKMLHFISLKNKEKIEIVNNKSIKDLNLSTYIDSSRVKLDIYECDYPAIHIEARKDTYDINVNTMRWFFSKNQRLNDEDAKKVFGNSTHKFYLKEFNEVLEHTDSKVPEIITGLCKTINGEDIIEPLKELIQKKGIKPNFESYEYCTKRFNNQPDKLVQVLEILKI